MGFLSKNIEKIMCGFFLIVFMLGIVIYKTGLIKEAASVIFPQRPEKFDISGGSEIEFEKLNKLIKRIAEPVDALNYSALAERNLFYEYEEPKIEELPFSVKHIEAVALDIMYMGLMELLDNKLVAQINVKGKTYFLKKKDVFGEYTVETITKDFCIILNQENEQLKLPYKKQVFSEEYEALIYDTKNKSSLKVKKGFKIREYEILDIKDSYVVLLNTNGKKNILRKEKE